MIWQNLNAINITVYNVFREPSKELAEPLGSAEPRLKNTALGGWAGEGYGTVSPDDTRQAGGRGLAKVFLPQGATVQVTLDLTYFPKF